MITAGCVCSVHDHGRRGVRRRSGDIKIIAGSHQRSQGELLVDDEATHLRSPREALGKGIATVYQDLAVVPLMPIWRNFFLGSELRRGVFMDVPALRRTAKEALAAMGIDLRDVDRPIGTLSGGERQCVAIARAVHFGALMAGGAELAELEHELQRA